MDDRRGRGAWWGAAALAGWAGARLLVGRTGLAEAMGTGDLLAEAVCEAVAGGAVLAWALWRRERLPGWREWRALGLLVLVLFAGGLLWRPYVGEVLRVHAAKASEQTMILIAGPMWVALLGVLRLVPEETPRQVAGAAIAGIAGYCLLLPADDLSVRLAEVPVLVLTVVHAVLLVWVYSEARRVFAGRPVWILAGCGMLVGAVVHEVAGRVLMTGEAVPVVWTAGVWSALSVAAVGTAVSGVLWYWMLTRLELPVFTMQVLVVWVAGVVYEVAATRAADWRVGLAVALGVGAVVVAMRARPGQEDPVRLGVA